MLTNDSFRWLIVGGAGQVGGALRDALGASHVDWTSRSTEAPIQLDLLTVAHNPRFAADLVEATGASLVVIAAGMTHVDGCEADPELATLVNRDAPRALAKAAHLAGARTIYLSTEYVFDGADGPYDEGAVTRPLSAYGRSKLDGERAVLDADPLALVVRTTVVYGPEAVGKNFAYQVAERLGRGEHMDVPCDQVSTPTYNRDLVKAVVAASRGGATGVRHVAGPQVLGRDEFGRALARAVGFDESLVHSVPTVELRQRAARPLSAGLVSSYADQCPADRHDVEQAVIDWLDRPTGRPWPGPYEPSAT